MHPQLLQPLQNMGSLIEGRDRAGEGTEMRKEGAGLSAVKRGQTARLSRRESLLLLPSTLPIPLPISASPFLSPSWPHLLHFKLLPSLWTNTSLAWGLTKKQGWSTKPSLVCRLLSWGLGWPGHLSVWGREAQRRRAAAAHLPSVFCHRAST